MFSAGQLIDDTYLLLRELGRGGFGEVFLAEELGDDEVFLGYRPSSRTSIERPVLRQVALKLLSLEAAQWRRFRVEVHALCRLNHPHIVQVFRYGRERVPYLAMEYVQGRTWWEALREPDRSSNPMRVLRALTQVADALQHAHEREVVHRDLKPHNILLTPDFAPKIVDFGLSVLLEPGQASTQRIGTPGYLAPELMEGDSLTCDHRADIYSLGALIYAAFVGRPMFEAPTLHQMVRRQLDNDIRFAPEFPEQLRALVTRCLDRDRTQRPRTAASVADELRRLAATTGVVRVGGEVSSLVAPEVQAERVDLVDARVRWVEAFEHPVRGPGVKAELVAGSAVHGEVVKLFAYAGPRGAEVGSHVRQLGALWPDAEVSLVDAVVVPRTDGERYLTVDNRTLLVVEPYMPVTVSEVSDVDGVRAGPCATRFLVDLRQRIGGKRAIVLGSIAHTMLERLFADHVSLEDPRAYAQLFDQALQRLRLDAVAAGIGDRDVPDLRHEIREHFDHLARWTSPRHELRQGQLSEVRRLSPRYGLEGRIDLALSDQRVLRILELKTGRYEAPQHEQQLRAYMLLWHAHAAATGRRVEGRLLYSRIGKERLLSPPTREDERSVCAARNEVVLLRHALAENDARFRAPGPDEQPVLCGDAACRFRRETCSQQHDRLSPPHTDLSAADPAARAYYDHFVRLLEREHRARGRRHGDLLRRGGLEDRIAAGDAVADASLTSLDEARRTARFVAAARSVFAPGDAVLIHRGDVEREVTLSGVVREVEDRSVLVSLRSTASLAELPAHDWVLDREESRIGHREMHRALFSFVAGVEPGRRDGVVHPETLRRWKLLPAPDAPPASRLNDNQRHAVAEGCRAELPVLLIQGPPGTGKTRVVAELIASLVAQDKRVLLAAFTNTAVDNVVARLLDLQVPGLLRVGQPYHVDADLEQAMQRAGLTEAGLFTGAIADETADLDLLRARMLAGRVIAATAHAVVSSPVFDIVEAPDRPEAAVVGTVPVFDVAVIDEASQLVEPLALGVLARAKRVVLVGDDCQLRPVVAASDATTAAVGESVSPLLQATGVAGLDRSLFERLKPFAPTVLLRVQYRMNDPIQAFPSQSFYGDQLLADAGVATRCLPLAAEALTGLDPELVRRLDPDRPSVWVDCGADGEGHVFLEEARQVARTASALWALWPGRTRDVPRELWLGVVTPFRAQAHAIRSELARVMGSEAAAIEVDTADRFQGREKEAILVSLASSSWSEFVFDRRRLNVALTRARTKVIVFGPRALGRRMIETYAPPEPEARPATARR